MSGAEVLKEVKWAGKYIPIVPVYGDEITDEEGKRHFRSLIRPAKGAQRMYNYMRNTGIEILALQPKVPFIGKKGAFDATRIGTRSTTSRSPLLEYDGTEKPERQPPPQGSQAVLQEALNASDDMKAIIGIYDPHWGRGATRPRARRSRPASARATCRPSTSSTTFSGRFATAAGILLDLIEKVYSTERMIRVLGEDLQPSTAQIAPTGQPVTQQQGPNGDLLHVYDITSGKYDLTVTSGPSYTTRREEVQQMLVRSSSPRQRPPRFFSRASSRRWTSPTPMTWHRSSPH
jgi:hypothetical protein